MDSAGLHRTLKLKFGLCHTNTFQNLSPPESARLRWNQWGSVKSSIIVRAANLKHWLAQPNCPPFIEECKRVFDQAFGNSEDDKNPISQSAFHPVPAFLCGIIKSRRLPYVHIITMIMSHSLGCLCILGIVYHVLSKQ